MIVQVVLVVYNVVGRPTDSKVLFIPSGDKLFLPTERFGSYTKNETVESLGGKILKNFLGLDAKVNGVGWIPLQLLCIDDDPSSHDDANRSERVITIALSCTIPEAVTPKNNARWYSVKELSEAKFFNNHRKIALGD